MRCHSGSLPVVAITCVALRLFFSSAAAVPTIDEKNLVGEVRNLSVKVVAFDNDVDDLDDFENNVILKLNVSWLPPASGRAPSFYSVLITSISTNTSLNTTNNVTTLSLSSPSSSCTEGSIYYIGQDIGQTHVLLPENRFGDGTLLPMVDDAAQELDIEPGCSYRVQVFANPRSNLGNGTKLAADLPPSTIYTVPECVGGWCNCGRALAQLPVPLISAKSLYNGSTLISWNVEPQQQQQSQIKSYKISIGTPHLTSSSGLLVYNKTVIFISTTVENNNSFVWDDENTKKGTKIFVTAQDSYGCSGREGTYPLKKPRPHPFYRKNATAIVFAGLVALCLVLSGVCSFVKYVTRNHNYKLVSLRKKSTRQFNSVLHNPRIEALLKNRSVIYVEQEIEEARRKDLADEYEISYERLNMVRQLGQGQFGSVYLANLLPSCTAVGEADLDDDDEKGHLVAVKMSSLDSARAQLEVRQQLLEEISIAKIAGSHPHLVGLLGCCTLPASPVCLVLEYMRGGDLLGYLHRTRDAYPGRSRSKSSNTSADANSDLESPGISSLAETTCTSLDSQSPRSTSTSSRVFFASDIKPEDIAKLESTTAASGASAIGHAEMMRFALEIARGMEHLEAKGIVHRDLAARNVLMSDSLVLKISDFGLSRKGVYTLDGASGVRRLPIRWMSPEAIRRRAFTSKSDVWSYGVTLWEIATLGDFPYPGLDDADLLQCLLCDEDAAKAELDCDAPVDLREVMDMCWAGRPESRPSFAQVVAWVESKRNRCVKSNPIYIERESYRTLRDEVV